MDIKGFEAFLDSIPFLDPSAGPIIIDEIGKMECLSEKFRNLLKKVLDSGKLVIATIALKGGGLIGEIKEREDIKIFEITPHNREALLVQILKEIRG